MDLDPLIFGHRLRHFRRKKGMTLDDLGAVIGRPAPFLSLMENGKREPKLSQIGALAAALDVSSAELLDPAPPNRRADLEVRLERAQAHPRYEQLDLPHLKATSRLPDDAIEHIVALFEALIGAGDRLSPGSVGAGRANADLAAWLAGRNGHLADLETTAHELLERAGYTGPGPLTGRHLRDLAGAFGYVVRPVDDMPPSLRSIVDDRHRRIYVAQRNELRTRQARKAVIQTVAAIALGHRSPHDVHQLLRQRLETAYVAAAVLVPERSAVPFLRTACAERDLSVEDLKEQFYVSYEMAAQRFTNLASHRLGIRTHFLRTDRFGVILKSYANDGVPLPADEHGGSDGRRVCRHWGARTAFESDERFDIHHQFTDTPAGSFWCATHLEPSDNGHAFTVGVRFEDARLFRGRRASHHRTSTCPDPGCCQMPDPEAAAAWHGQLVRHERVQADLLGLLTPALHQRYGPAEMIAFAERHAREETSSPSEESG